MRIASALRARLGRDAAAEGGFTLVELLAASVLFMVLAGITFTTVIVAARHVSSSRDYNDINEEARVMLNRMSREIREAKAVVAVTNPLGQSGFNAQTSSQSLTFDVDFDGDGTIEPNAADPERLTYSYDPAAKRVTLSAAGTNYPILAANVTSFSVDYTSRLYLADGWDGSTKDGVVHWWELDADPSQQLGNGNGKLDTELSSIDGVTIAFSVFKGTRRQDYRTQVDLRNRPY